MHDSISFPPWAKGSRKHSVRLPPADDRHSAFFERDEAEKIYGLFEVGAMLDVRIISPFDCNACEVWVEPADHMSRQISM